MARIKSTLTPEEADPQSAIIPERVQKILDLYNRNHIEYTWKEEDRNEQTFEFRRTLKPQTYKYTINRIDRVRDATNRKKEYYFYQMEATCLNENDGTERTGNLTYGYAVEEVTEIKFDPNTRKKVPVKIRDDPIYLYEWNPKEVKKLLDGSDVPCMNFYFGTSDRRGQPGNGINDVKPVYNQDDFLNATFDQLIVINKARLGDANTPALPLVKQAEDELQKKEMDKLKQITKESSPNPTPTIR
jgi:hypothetical protein